VGRGGFIFKGVCKIGRTSKMVSALRSRIHDISLGDCAGSHDFLLVRIRSLVLLLVVGSNKKHSHGPFCLDSGVIKNSDTSEARVLP
jgi:hypothetical protein